MDHDSVVDVGCGCGNWARAALDLGVTDCLGVDGDYVDRKSLRIPEEKFLPCDLQKDVELKRKYSMAICLEVAEHIAEENSDILIKNLCNSSDIILFSAAIPGQGGTNHINEQFPSYWNKKFGMNGFEMIDCIRSVFWNDKDIPVWYKQNMFLVAKKENKKTILDKFPYHGPCDVVHPEVFKDRARTSMINSNVKSALTRIFPGPYKIYKKIKTSRRRQSV